MDLHKLTKQSATQRKTDDATPSVPPPKRKWVTRIALPLAIVLVTLSLILYAARDVIRPATEVRTTQATAVTISDSTATSDRGSTQASTVVVQAPGWVEPDPYPIYASALADGVVEQVFVLEGESIKTGQPLVKLNDEDAKLDLAKARAELAMREAVLIAAQTDLNEPISLRRDEAVAESLVKAAEAARLRLDAEVAKEQARLDELTAAYDRLRKLSKQSVSDLQVEEAKYKMLSQRALLDATQQRGPELDAAIVTAKAEYTAASRNLELKTDLKRRYDEAKASRDAVQARVEEAELRLERMTIKSPVDGVVMRRRVSPGDKLMLRMDNPYSAHAIHLYDPAALQVRVDVPLADAAQVGMGQRAKIVLDVLPDIEFLGEVTRLVHLADIAKNTVQFKVAITDPSPLLKPDMLARVKFYSSNGGGRSTQANNIAASATPVAIKQSAILEEPDGSYVWWVSPLNQRIERRKVIPGEMRSDSTVLLLNGLNPGDVVIDQPDEQLYESQRVRPVALDN